MVIGTSAQVSPACDIPGIAKESGAAVVEINPEETPLSGNVTDIHLKGSASEVLGKMLRMFPDPVPPFPKD